MKKLAILAMVLMLSFVAFAPAASAGGCCCKVSITGYVFICSYEYGMTVPGAEVKVNGDLWWYFKDCAYTDPYGVFNFENAHVLLDNYPCSWLTADYDKQVGSYLWSYVNYHGQSDNFTVTCFVAGEPVKVTMDIPMWLR